MHQTAHPLAGKKVVLKVKAPGPQGTAPQDGEYRIEDWCDRVLDCLWMDASVWAAINYGVRTVGHDDLRDDEVLYGKQAGLGYLVHASEIVAEA